MGIIELLFLAVGLSMDAFAVAICKGLAMEKITFKKAAICGLWFGGFQGAMPLVGYLLGIRFTSFIVEFDHWIAFGLLAVIGGNMIKEAVGRKEIIDYEENASLGIKTMFMMAVATSIDALAVGVTFACIPVSIASYMNEWQNTVAGAGIICIITFIISCIGVKIGNVFGEKYKSKAELAGGVVLIALGLKILLEHLINKV